MTKVNQSETQKTSVDMTAVSTKTNKRFSTEEVKLRQEKPIIGGGLTSNTGAIKKAKLLLKEEKKKDNKVKSNEKIHKTMAIDKERETPEPSVFSQTATIIESQESIYSVGNLEENTISTKDNTNSPRLLNRRVSVSPNELMEAEDFQFPRRYTGWSELIKAKTKESFTINTENKYDSLCSDSEEDAGAKAVPRNQQKETPKKKLIKRRTHTQTQGQSQKRDQKQNTEKRTEMTGEKKKIIPPPVVLKGELKNLGEVKKRLKEECNILKVTFKYTRYNTLILVENEKDHDRLVEYFKSQQVDITNKEAIEFHTYTSAPKKTHAFVIRGLDCNPEPGEVQAAFLEEYEIEISNVYQMHTKYRPLYMIVTSSAITQKYLQNTVRYLMSVRVFIEERQNVRRIIQCHRCQEWGHATSNCYRAPRCLKCAEGHATKECEKPKESEPKCCNCGGKHPANATHCKVYQNKLMGLEGRGSEKKKYVPAPQPKENAWQGGARATKRTDERQVQEHTSGGENQAAGVCDPSQQTSEPRRSSGNENTRNCVVDEVTNSVKMVEELNKKVNFKELNRALNDLNQNMRHVKSGVEAFQIYYQFIESLENNYQILN